MFCQNHGEKPPALPSALLRCAHCHGRVTVTRGGAGTRRLLRGRAGPRGAPGRPSACRAVPRSAARCRAVPRARFPITSARRRRRRRDVCLRQGRICIRPTNKGASPILGHGRYAPVGGTTLDTPLLRALHTRRLTSDRVTPSRTGAGRGVAQRDATRCSTWRGPPTAGAAPGGARLAPWTLVRGRVLPGHRKTVLTRERATGACLDSAHQRKAYLPILFYPTWYAFLRGSLLSEREADDVVSKE